MKSKMIKIIIGMLLCLGTQTVSSFTKNDSGWIELGETRMSAYYNGIWHWETAIVFKLSNASSLAFRIRYEGKYYPVRAEMEGGQIRCSAWIPYEGEKHCFSFWLPIS